MNEEKVKGFWSKIFGKKESACCNLKIEEVTDDAAQDPGAKDANIGKSESAKPLTQTGCCGASEPKTPSGKCCG